MIRLFSMVTIIWGLGVRSAHAGEIKTELKNQFIGGLIGSVVGAGAGAGLAALSPRNDLADLRKYITLPLYGQAIGNSIGHYAMTEKKNPYPLFLSLAAGLSVTAVLTRDNSKHLDGDYYRFMRPYGGDIGFIASLALYQPIITTLSHILWPEANTAVAWNYAPGGLQGITVSQTF